MKIVFKSFLIISLILLNGSAFASTTHHPYLFKREQDAKAHCPKDTVVWLNLLSGIYLMKGQSLYGKTINGSYTCKKDADMYGDHTLKNGN